MFLKITTPDSTVFEWEVQKLSIPTENGIITVLDNHMPLVSVVVPGILTIWSDNIPQEEKTFAFLSQWKWFALSVSKWFLFVDGENINVVTSGSDKKYNSSNELKEAKIAVQENIEKLREKWAIEEVEKKLVELKKIDADIKLYEIKELSAR